MGRSHVSGRDAHQRVLPSRVFVDVERPADRQGSVRALQDHLHVITSKLKIVIYFEQISNLISYEVRKL